MRDIVEAAGEAAVDTAIAHRDANAADERGVDDLLDVERRLVARAETADDVGDLGG